jgi:hypothetical protein
MLCNRYSALTDFEQKIFTGSLIHAVLNDDEVFLKARGLIREAEARNVFKGVKIMPHVNNITPMSDDSRDPNPVNPEDDSD